MSSTDASPALLLVVDDDEDVRMSLAEALSERGFAVTTAADGKQALEVARERPPSVILLDLMMPKMNGWQFWDEHQTDAKLRNIPVVIITATGLGPGALGKVPVLRKPLNLEHLVTVLQRAIAPSTPSK